MSKAIDEFRQALGCLYIAVDEHVARDVAQKADAAINELLSEISTLKESRAVLADREQAVRNEANQLRVKCAEMRKALVLLKGEADGRIVYPKEIFNTVNRALSTDCVKGT